MRDLTQTFGGLIIMAHGANSQRLYIILDTYVDDTENVQKIISARDTRMIKQRSHITHVRTKYADAAKETCC